MKKAFYENKRILEQVKSENSLDVLIEKYKEIDNFFNTEN
jgi:hypothetical protein